MSKSSVLCVGRTTSLLKNLLFFCLKLLNEKFYFQLMNLKKNVIFLNFQTCKNIQRTLKCTILNMFLLYNGMGSPAGLFFANNNKNETKIVCGNTIVFLQKYNNNKKKWCHEATTTWCSCVINGIVALFLLVVVFNIYKFFSLTIFFCWYMKQCGMAYK